MCVNLVTNCYNLMKKKLDLYCILFVRSSKLKILRGKYQERYDILPVCKVEGSSQTPLHLMVTDGVIDFYSFLSIIPKGLSFNSFPMGPIFMP